MGGSDDDSNAGLADFEMTQAMDDGDTVDIPRLAYKDADLFELLRSHRLVCFVNQMQCAFSFGVVAHDALEYTDCAVFAAKQFACDLLRVDDIASDLIQLALAPDSQR